VELDTLRDLFVKELSDIYSAEKQLLKALPKMAEAASFAELRQAFELHLEQTENQVDRLDRVFKAIGEKPTRHKCKGMAGLIQESNELLKEPGEPAALDAGMIAAAQRVEHYEIAAYGTARTYAETLGEQDAARLLQETLNEESETNEKLTQIATSTVNPAASVNPSAAGER
jgi:ferritin-like metal-binding protein YciE